MSKVKRMLSYSNAFLNWTIEIDWVFHIILILGRSWLFKTINFCFLHKLRNFYGGDTCTTSSSSTSCRGTSGRGAMMWSALRSGKWGWEVKEDKVFPVGFCSKFDSLILGRFCGHARFPSAWEAFVSKRTSVASLCSLDTGFKTLARANDNATREHYQ